MSQVEDGQLIEYPTEVDSVGDFHEMPSIPAPTAAPQATPTNEEAFTDFMRGQNHGHDSVGAQGMTTDTPEARQAIMQEAHNEETARLAQLEQAQHPQQPQGQDFQKLYGQSENEKGELRRALEEQARMTEQLQSQMIQLQTANVQTPQFFGPTQGQVAQPQIQPQAQYAPTTPQYNYDPSMLPRLMDKHNDEDMVVAGDVERVLREKVGPLVAHVDYQAQVAQSQVADANRRMFEMQKSQAQITPAIEQQLLIKNPWLGSVTDPGAYLNALINLKQQTESQALLQRVGTGTPAPQSTQAPPQSGSFVKASRRYGFIEGGGNAAAPGGQVSSVQKIQAQWEATKAMAHGDPNRTKAQKALLAQMGTFQVSGYRDPNILT